MQNSFAVELRMPSEPQIEIRQSWCKGCEFCVATCAQGVLRMDNGKPVVEDPGRCTGCGLCVWICPDFAIKIRNDAIDSSAVAEK
jgi:NAD-dependent dihydropyrimidine dehydrogenase PreA subunit